MTHGQEKFLSPLTSGQQRNAAAAVNNHALGITANSIEKSLGYDCCIAVYSSSKSKKLSGAAEARRAHNPEDTGSKPVSAILFILFFSLHLGDKPCHLRTGCVLGAGGLLVGLVSGCMAMSINYTIFHTCVGVHSRP